MADKRMLDYFRKDFTSLNTQLSKNDKENSPSFPTIRKVSDCSLNKFCFGRVMGLSSKEQLNGGNYYGNNFRNRIVF